jgi:hypothetical protein
MSERSFSVVVTSGDLQPTSHDGVIFPHRWTPAGVVVQSEFTGAHLLHLSIAGCVLNDVHREAERLGVHLFGVRVSAWGNFDRKTWQSTGNLYSVDVNTSASSQEVQHLLAAVDEVAEIPKAVRSGGAVSRVRPKDPADCRTRPWVPSVGFRRLEPGVAFVANPFAIGGGSGRSCRRSAPRPSLP